MSGFSFCPLDNTARPKKSDRRSLHFVQPLPAGKHAPEAGTPQANEHHLPSGRRLKGRGKG